MKRLWPALPPAPRAPALLGGRWLNIIAVAAAFILSALSPASSQTGPDGIGFAQAEEGTWSCRAGDPVTALNCARDLCRAEAGGQDCYRTAWCFPAGWAGIVTVWTEDFHSNRPVCGAPSLKGLLVAMRSFCDNADGATACDIGLVMDPAGVEVDVAQHWTPARACDAAGAAFIIGRAAAPDVVETARLAAGAEIVRVVGPGDIITMEFRADRLTLNIDAGDIIRDAKCG